MDGSFLEPGLSERGDRLEAPQHRMATNELRRSRVKTAEAGDRRSSPAQICCHHDSAGWLVESSGVTDGAVPSAQFIARYRWNQT